MSAIDDLLASRASQPSPSTSTGSSSNLEDQGSAIDQLLASKTGTSKPDVSIFAPAPKPPVIGPELFGNLYNIKPQTQGPVVPTLGLPGSQPMKLADVGKNLPNVTDVLSGPRLSTLQALQRGEQVNVTPTPTQTSQRTIQQQQVLKSENDIQAQNKAQVANRLFSPEHIAARLNTDLTNGLNMADLLFAPISKGIEAAKNIQLTPTDQPPGMFEIPKAIVKYGATAISYPFEKAGGAAVNYINGQLDAIPQNTPEQKALVDQWRPILTRGASLIAMLAAGEAVHTATSAPGDIVRTIDGIKDTNGIVNSAKSILNLPKEGDLIGRAKKVDPAEIQSAYRQAAHATHPDRGGNPGAFNVVNQAKTVLEDHNTLSPKDFNAKYQTMLEGAKTVTKLLPESGQAESPKTAIEQVLEQKQQAADHAKQIFTPELVKPKETGITPETKGYIDQLTKLAKGAGFSDVKIRTIPVQDNVNNQTAPTGVNPGTKELLVHPETLQADISHLEAGHPIETTIDGKTYTIKTIPDYLDKLVQFEKGHLTGATVGDAQAIAQGKGAEVSQAMDQRVMAVKPELSKIGKSIEAKSIEKGLTESFGGTASYTPVTIKEQAARAADLMTNDMARAERIIRGQEKLPDGLLGGTLIKAMEDHAMATSNAQLALDIARSPLTSETSVHAQEMRMLAERNPDSIVANLQKLKRIKEDAAAKTGIKKEKVVKEIKEAIKKQKKTQTKQSWSQFIDSITC